MKLFARKKRSSKEPIRQPRFTQSAEEDMFRRSRTLTVSDTKEGGGPELASERLKRHKLRRKRRQILWGLVMLFMVIAALLYVISQYIGGVEIDEVLPAGIAISAEDQSRYQSEVISYLQKHPSERFLFSLESQKLSDTVRKKYPEVESVKLSGGSWIKGNFTLTLRKPVASWKLSNRQYFVDVNGEAFEKNYFAPPSVNIVDNSGAVVAKGNTVVSQKFLRFLGRLVALAGESGLGQISEASLPPNTTRQIDIKLEGRGYVIKTHIDRDPAGEIEDLRRVIQYLETRKITPSYIDVRVEGRAFYK